MRNVEEIFKVFWDELEDLEKLTGISHGAIVLSLARMSKSRKRDWEAKLWQSAATEASLKNWIRRSEYSDEALREVAALLPAWAKRSLLDIANSIASKNRGRPRRLRFRQRQDMLKRFRELTDRQNPDRVTKDQAYRIIADEFRQTGGSISTHAVRTTCDPKERARNARPGKALIQP